MNAIMERWIGRSAANCSTAPSSGTCRTYAASCATRPITTPTGRTWHWPAPHRTSRCSARSRRSRGLPHPKTRPGRRRHPRISPSRLTCTDDISARGHPVGSSCSALRPPRCYLACSCSICRRERTSLSTPSARRGVQGPARGDQRSGSSAGKAPPDPEGSGELVWRSCQPRARLASDAAQLVLDAHRRGRIPRGGHRAPVSQVAACARVGGGAGVVREGRSARIRLVRNWS